MKFRTNSTAMGGLPTIVPRLLYYTTSATPSTVLNLAVKLSGTAANVGPLVTFTATKAHGMLTGQAATISGASDTYLNGTYTITVVSEKVFTYTMLTTQANVSDSAFATYPCAFQRAILIADSANSVSISFGPNGDADQDIILKGTSYLLEAPSGARHDISDWNIKAAAASQNFRVSIV